MANPSRLSSIRADAIVLGAAAQGWIDIQHYSRLTVMEATERHIRSSSGNNSLLLPLICPDATLLNRLWEQTVSKEARLFHSSSSQDSSSGLASERIAQLRQGFQHLVDQQTYCHVNVTAVLEDLDWRRFLSQFQGEPGGQEVAKDSQNNKH